MNNSQTFETSLNLGLHENELKLYSSDKVNKNNVQTHTIGEDKALVSIGQKILKPATVMIGFCDEKNTILKARYGDDIFQLGDPALKSIRVTVDLTKPEKTKLHVTCGDQYTVLSKKQTETKYLILFIEHPSFIQLIVFDSQLDQKVSRLISSSGGQGIEELRTLAYSMLNQKFPQFINKIRDLDEKSRGI